MYCFCFFFFFSSRRRHTRWNCDWSSDVCSSDLHLPWQRGQSGQPSPDPVPRTVPPAPISTSVITVVASDSFWNRFTRRGPPEGTNGSWAGGHYSAGAASVDRQGALHGVRVDVALEVVLARRQ